jgi:hypothetical protein
MGEEKREDAEEVPPEEVPEVVEVEEVVPLPMVTAL